MGEVPLYAEIPKVNDRFLPIKDAEVSIFLRHLSGYPENPNPVCLLSKEDPSLVTQVVSPSAWDLTYSCAKVRVCRGITGLTRLESHTILRGVVCGPYPIKVHVLSRHTRQLKNHPST